MEGQPLFIDLIFKIILHRAYVNIRERKLLTAESILQNAAQLLRHFKGKRLSYRIVTDKEFRANARPYELMTLEKKYFLMQGILAQSLSKPVEAQDWFLKSMALDDDYFIPSNRRECIIRLANSL